MAIVYKIINKINGKFYIGQTIRTFEQRWIEHCRDANNSEVSTYFHSAIKKYGKENFEHEIIEANVDDNIILDVESYYIETLHSNDNKIGYNTTLDGKYCEKKIKDNNIVIDIIDMIKITNLSFAQIANKFKVSKCVVSAINKGISYKQEDIEYPIRETNINRLLMKEEVRDIVHMLQSTKISMPKIAEMYDIHRMTITKINNGLCYLRYIKDLKLEFPIRKEQSKELSWEYVENIIYPELINPNNKSLQDIANKLDIGIHLISRINNGDSHKEHLLKRYPDITFPIKHIGYEKKIKDDNIIYEVVELLKYTSFTLQQIIYIIKEKYGNDLTNSLYKINAGNRYRTKIDKMFVNLEYPIREQSNKKIIFTKKEDIEKEKYILSKYNIEKENLPLSYGEKLK